MREEYLKIWDLDICQGMPGIITGAGRVAFIAKYRQSLQEACATHRNDRPIRTCADFVRIAEHTMQNMAREYGTERMARLGMLRPGGNGEQAHVQQPLGMFPELLAVVGIHDEKPHIFVVSPDGIAEEQQAFGAEGSGGPFGEYLLPKFYHPEITVAEAELAAIHIVEQVEHADPHSGGPVQLASILKRGGSVPKVKRWTAREVQKALVDVADIESQVSSGWQKVIRDIANNRVHRRHRSAGKK